MWHPELISENLSNAEWFDLYEKQHVQAIEILGNRMHKMQVKIQQRKKKGLNVDRWVLSARLYRKARDEYSKSNHSMGRFTRSQIHGYYWDYYLQQIFDYLDQLEYERLKPIYERLS